MSDNKLSNNKLSNNKLSDNNLASELVENWTFLNQFSSEEIVIFMIIIIIIIIIITIIIITFSFFLTDAKPKIQCYSTAFLETVCCMKISIL